MERFKGEPEAVQIHNIGKRTSKKLGERGFCCHGGEALPRKKQKTTKKKKKKNPKTKKKKKKKNHKTRTHSFAQIHLGSNTSISRRVLKVKGGFSEESAGLLRGVFLKERSRINKKKEGGVGG